MNEKSDNFLMKRKQLCEVFSAGYDSAMKQIEISNRLDSQKIDDVREKAGESYAALDNLTKKNKSVSTDGSLEGP